MGGAEGRVVDGEEERWYRSLERSGIGCCSDNV